MAPRPRDITVVVVSYNTRELLRHCLSSLLISLERTSAEYSWEVIVADNASADGSAALVRASFPDVRLIALAENRGFAAANNAAIRASESRFVLFLNPDTLVYRDAPAALARFLDRHPDAAVCGGRLVNADGSFQHSCFKFPTLPMTFFDFFPLNHRIADSRWNGRYPVRWYTHPFPIDHPLGACMMVRRAAIDRVGLLDEGFFMYCEEVDWCYRFKAAGWRSYYTPDAVVVHLGGQSTGQQRGRMFVELHRSRDRFFRKHYGAWFAGVALLIVRLGLARDWLRDRSRRANAGEASERIAVRQAIAALAPPRSARTGS